MATQSLRALRRTYPPAAADCLPAIQALNRQLQRKLVVLDDDPTGTQTIQDLPVVTTWDADTLSREFAAPEPAFFILTNSRALEAQRTRALHQEIGQALAAAAQGRPFALVSRSDSTLRGHYPAETDVLAAALGGVDILVLAPAFEAGGRLTAEDVHYVAHGDTLTPAHETPFARDAAFGYTTAHLRAWVAEKTEGTVPAERVFSCSITDLRQTGAEALAGRLGTLPRGSVCIVNALERRDLEVFAHAALLAEQAGVRILYRTAASLVAALAGQPTHPLWTPTEGEPLPRRGGLIVAGSYVPKTTAQLAHLRQQPALSCIELPVASLMQAGARQTLIADCGRQLNEAIEAGRDVLLMTSRELVSFAHAEQNLEFGRQVSETLVEIVRSLRTRPRFFIAKGGITSSDLATQALEVRRAQVLGQILPGVPVWQLGPESRFPGLPYVIFPGNVGGPEALSQGYRILRAESPAR